MFLFSRAITFTGSPRQTLGFATQMTEKVRSLTDIDVGLWTSIFGQPVGTLIWSSRIESRAHLAQTQQTLLGDDGYHDLIEQARDLVTQPGEDTLSEFVSEPPTGAAPPVGSIAEVTNAVAAAGRLADAMGWGAEMAEIYSSVTGAPAAFLADAYGTFGSLRWVAIFSDAADVDKANAATQADEAYMKRLSEAGELFIPGSGQTGLGMRVA